MTEMLEPALDPTRQYGSSSFTVTLQLLDTLEVIAAQTDSAAKREAMRKWEAMRRQARLIHGVHSALTGCPSSF